MADSNCKVNTNVSRDLRPPIHSNPGSQSCVRKTFSASFVPQPAENHTLFTAISKTSLKNKSSMLKKSLFKSISSILIPKSSAKNTRKTNSKRGNQIIFSPPDEILQRSERKGKVVHQKDDKNKAIILI